ncbi:MAG: helix-turn-helix transcriptional regulator [Propionicimonas sp.]
MTDSTHARDSRAELGDFLKTRRARLGPADVGLPVYTGGRRVPGLRREEVALLASMSVEYYTRIERGSFSGISESVLDGIAHALRLDEAEQSHLRALAGTPTQPDRQRRRPTQQRIRPALQRVLDAMPLTPAFILSSRSDILATNALGRALNQPLYESQGERVNHARFLFLDRRSAEFWRDWAKIADQTVATLRTEAGRNPFDRDLTDLVGELATRSDEFRTRWATHNVRLHTHGTKRIHHPLVGDLDLPFETIPLPADPGQSLLVYSPEPQSRTQDALNLLASWSANLGASGSSSPAAAITEARINTGKHEA